MSAYTTLRVQRSTALNWMLGAVMNGISDEQLEHFMDRALDERLYNCRIVPDGDDNDEDLL